jgi:quinol---cytochrome-c reductase cytochrome c subunit
MRRAGLRGLHRLLVAVPLVVAAAATPVVMAAASPGQAGPDQAQLTAGRELFVTGCASCHGERGEGGTGPDGDVRGPSLRQSGAAGAYYYLSTGRMPLANPDDQPVRKPPAYTARQIDALVAYVASLGNGPAIPRVDVAKGDLAAGGEIFRGNCQACHSASGSGGALSYGRAAPNLSKATPKQVGAAIRVGPGQMPVFSPDIISDRQLDSLARYVEYLHHPEDPGGIPIGRTGPIPEGFVAWLIGLVALVLLVAWIGSHAPVRRAGLGRAAAADGEGEPTTEADAGAGAVREDGHG